MLRVNRHLSTTEAKVDWRESYALNVSILININWKMLTFCLQIAQGFLRRNIDFQRLYSNPLRSVQYKDTQGQEYNCS